jgi:hypothetical protein
VLSEDLIGAIQQIIILGKGDQGRLEYLLDVLQKERPLPESDKKYLQMIIPLYLGPQDPESYKKNVESAITKLHDEIRGLDEKMTGVKSKGFEKYVGRKTILFFITIFVGWNALQSSYVLPVLSYFVPNSIAQYVFPLNLVATYFNYGQIVWFAFLILATSWPFIGLIHMVKFIKSRKISNNS